MIENSIVSKIISGDESDPKVRIAKAAISEFALRSLEGARIREIAKQSQTNIAAISYHFGGKKELYRIIINEMSDFFDDFVDYYYKKGQVILKNSDSKEALNLVRDFLIGSIQSFCDIKIVSDFCLIMMREESSPSEAFKRIYESVYQRPIEFIAKLLTIAAKSELQKDLSLVFAQGLWSNVRAYSAQNQGVMRLHGWKKIGEKQIQIIKTALEKVLSKTLRDF